MNIIFKKDSLFYSLFSLSDGSSDTEVEETLEKDFLSLGVKVSVKVTDFIEVTILEDYLDHSRSVDKVANLASQGKYKEALAVIDQELKLHPTLSELYRMQGQIFSDQGNQEKGINSLIDALRFDPTNKWALIMMGNIYARERGDVETGLVYYEKALEVDPTDNIALNNIGAMLLESGKRERGLELFNQALKVDPTYPNTYLGLSLAHQKEQDFQQSFQTAVDGLKKAKNDGRAYKALTNQAFETARLLVGQNSGLKIAQGFIAKLEEQSKKSIRLEETENIPFTAKLEIAENYNRDYHLVRYKNDSPAIAHLILHELIHLELVLEARVTNENELFITSKKHELAFKSRLGKYIKLLKKKGFGSESIKEVIGQLFSGLNSQVYNTPIDQFIEQRIYNQFPQLRPHQFLSLLKITTEGIQAVTKKEIVELSDPWILDKSKIYNIINTLGFKRWYGLDMLKDLKASGAQKRTAKKLFLEFEEYLKNKKPAEEYDLVNNWADTLGMLPYFKLIKESEYRRNQNDPIHVPAPDLITESSVPEEKRAEDIETFQKAHADKDINMAVVMFMIGALKRFKPMRQSQVKDIAFQIAQIGINGISPEKDGYHVPLIPSSSFSGYQMLAHYYVSWAIAVPEMLSQINMPFEKEYETALKFYKK